MKKSLNKFDATVLPLLFFFLCTGTLFLSTSAFVSAQLTPKKYCCIFGVLILILTCIIYSFFKKTSNQKNITSVLCYIIPVLCVAQALSGILQYLHILPSSSGFPISGSFDNPAGFAASLCAGFPFLFYAVFAKKSWERRLAVIAILFIIFAVVLSGSRAGIISLFVVVLFITFYKLRLSIKLKIILLSISFILAVAGLYFLKKDSANGRLLIWRCSYEMIKDKPMQGFGYGGFKANYMNYQARYFEEHPDSKYVMLADNVDRPFNEYLLFLVNLGALGAIPVLLLLWVLQKSYRANKHKTLLTDIAVWCLLSIAVFSLFSYPLTYPFVVLMGIVSLYIIVLDGWKIRLNNLAKFILIILVLLIGWKTYDRMTSEMKWCRIANKSLLGQTERMLPEYQSLYYNLQNDELFLYNYAAELNVVKRYDKSLKIALECEQLWADYDLQMLIADNYQHLQQNEKAEIHYLLAASMCPVKFIPLYKLFQLYESQEEYEKTKRMAEKILNKPIKVNSQIIENIKQEINEKVNNNFNSTI
jgi:O-antigen ligase